MFRPNSFSRNPSPGWRLAHRALKQVCVFLFLFCILCSALPCSGNPPDSAFLNNVKKFIFSQIPLDSEGRFYSSTGETGSPDFILYVSVPGKVEKPAELVSGSIQCGTNENQLHQLASTYENKGYHVFPYQSYGTYDTRLSEGFLSYPDEARVFIMFHQLSAHFIIENRIDMPYGFMEALCDVIGNYGTQQYAKTLKDKSMLRAARQQTRSNERIYTCINDCISKVFDDPEKQVLHRRLAEQEIREVLVDGNAFQNQRFRHTVNNAYLLRYFVLYYYYSMMKSEFEKGRSVKKFLERIKKMYGPPQ